MQEDHPEGLAGMVLLVAYPGLFYASKELEIMLSSLLSLHAAPGPGHWSASSSLDSRKSVGFQISIF